MKLPKRRLGCGAREVNQRRRAAAQRGGLVAVDQLRQRAPVPGELPHERVELAQRPVLGGMHSGYSETDSSAASDGVLPPTATMSFQTYVIGTWYQDEQVVRNAVNSGPLQ